MISRSQENLIVSRIKDNKVVVLYGPRQTGKTTLAKKIASESDTPYAIWNCDETDMQVAITNASSQTLKNMIGNNTLIIIDEAQRIENIGLTLKIIHDTIPDVKVIATGSSSFELADKINEPLTGRKWEYNILPISFEEMVHHTDWLTEKRQLRERLIYGYYPEVVTKPNERRDVLQSLASSALYKDILTWKSIKYPDRLGVLVRALAFQLGQQVSYNELAQTVQVDKETIERYIDLLEKAYIVYRLYSYSGNLRNELKKSRKIYFYDNGLRNAIINDFKPLDLRTDVGALWENWLMAERLKYIQKNKIYCNRFFWRTNSQQEIDYIEERDGNLYAFEYKWNLKAKGKITKTFTNHYRNAIGKVITPDNMEEFILN
jgi:predicted AAA+ superfamily ATPase